MATAALVLLSGAMNAWALVAVAVVVGTLDGFFLPAVAALPVRVAPPNLIGRVAALRTLTQRVGMLGGGPLAGWLIYLFGPSAAFLGSAILFALSVGSLALVTLAPRRSPGPTAEPGTDAAAAGVAHADPPPRTTVLSRTWAETTTGFQIVRASSVLAGLLLLIGGMNFGFSGPFTAGIPLLAAARGWGAPGAGC
jgi:MFS family permease